MIEPADAPTRGDLDRIVFLLDVDNTLLDNDRLKEDISARIEQMVGAGRAARFWRIYEEVRQEEDFVDFPESIRRWSLAVASPEDGRKIEAMIEDLPFANYLYPYTIETIEYLETIGTPAILSDGDPVYQPLKIRKSGLQAAVHDRVLIFVHKENELPQMFARFLARHYVVVDDKPRILAALERECPTTFTTILVLQGKYAVEGEYSPKPDYVVHEIGELRFFKAEDFEKS